MAGKWSNRGNFGQQGLLFRRPSIVLLLSLLIVLFATPLANADAIYTFFDQSNNITVQFATPYIITSSTAPVQITTFLVAPSGFAPCTLQIFNGSTAGNTLGCTASGMVAGVQKTWEEIWIVMNNSPFPTTPGSFVIPFGDVQWGFSGDIAVDAGNIGLHAPEPASMLLLATGAVGLGLRRIRLHSQARRHKA